MAAAAKKESTLKLVSFKLVYIVVSRLTVDGVCGVGKA